MPEGGPTSQMRDEIERSIRLLAVPDGVVEIRAIADEGTHSGYFSDPCLAAASAELLDLPTVHGIYLTLNEVNPALLARRANRVKMRLARNDATTADSDIIRRRWFPIDIDPVRPSGVSATQEEHDLAMEKAGAVAGWLNDRGFPEPVRGDSGNGAHLLYRIDLPHDDESRQLIQQCLAVLGERFSDEKCTIDAAVCNAARIWKLYGTVSRKGDHTRERPHRRSSLVSVPEEIAVVPRGMIEALSHISVSTGGPGEKERYPSPRRTSPGRDILPQSGQILPGSVHPPQISRRIVVHVQKEMEKNPEKWVRSAPSALEPGRISSLNVENVIPGNPEEQSLRW
jgi:hypothetical protein